VHVGVCECACAFVNFCTCCWFVPVSPRWTTLPCLCLFTSIAPRGPRLLLTSEGLASQKAEELRLFMDVLLEAEAHNPQYALPRPHRCVLSSSWLLHRLNLHIKSPVAAAVC